jgi:translation initiation factor IF-2
MQQRRVRLGDILDDYCPRERRITNHAVVAMIEDAVKQTRCTTCDADHEYREAKIPAPRRRKAGALASGDVQTAGRPRPASPRAEEPGPADMPVEPPTSEEALESTPAPVETAPAEPDAAPPNDHDAEEPADTDRDEWPVHRPLIRATLPRPEGQPPDRKAPDFTFRASGGKFDAHRNGQRHRHRPTRHAKGQGQFGGQRPASGQGPRHGSGQPHGQRQGNRQGSTGGSRPGPARGQRQGGSGRKRGR